MRVFRAPFKFKNILAYILGLIVGFCVIVLCIRYIAQTSMGREFVYSKHCYDLTFKPVLVDKLPPKKFLVGQEDLKPFLEIQNLDGNHCFWILDSDAKKVITFNYNGKTLISAHGSNWKLSPDKDDIVISQGGEF